MNLEFIHAGPTFETNTCKYFETKQEQFKEKIFAQLAKEPFPSLDELAYLKNDYELSLNNNLNGVLSSFDMVQTDLGFVIYKEFFNGIPLEKYLLNWSFNVPQFLHIAIKLTKLLRDLHLENLIVKEFVIENILINPETQELKFCCLGSASNLGRERMEFHSEFNFYGSLWHIAPEQTGRIGRSIDYRTDFYSLGIIFYQILCKRKPFYYADSLELIHAHIAKNPIEPKNLISTIAEPINEIVLKLMSKNAEDRYQSEAGILEDLNHCLREWQNKGKLERFILGEKDQSSIFRLSEKLYGRKEEVNQLKGCWNRVQDGNCELFVVSGYSGIGKTRLITEMKKPIFETNGYFVGGKFDQLNREIPYSGFIAGIEQLLQIILAESDEQRSTWKDVITSHSDDSISVLYENIPSLKELIDNPGETIDLGPVEGKERIIRAFVNLLSIFKHENRNFAMFIDDLQWADSGSLDLINGIISADLSNVLLIGAYRDNEVDEGHPLVMTLNSIQEAVPEKIHSIKLQDLAFADMNQLIADSLKINPDTTQELTEAVLLKTRGNPFFVGQFLEKLVDERMIYFSYDIMSWLWDIESINNLEVSEYVVDLLLKKMSKLSPNAQQIISLAACIGNTFDVTTLRQISHRNKSEVTESLYEIIEEEYIHPLGRWSKYYTDDILNSEPHIKIKNQKFAFQHDRIQQAAYALIPKDDIEETHYQIGKILLQNQNIDGSVGEGLFDMLNHHNIGHRFATSKEERIKLAELNLLAAKKALRNNAIRSALTNFNMGMKFIDGDQKIGLFKSLLIGQSECEYLLGNYEASESLFDKAIENADSKLNKADIYSRKMALYENTQRHQKAIDTARQGLKLLGMDLPINTKQYHVMKELLTVKFLLRNKSTDQLLNNKRLESPEKILSMKILMNLWGPVYLLQKQELLAYKILKMVNISIRYGNSIESALAYAFYGYVISAQLKDYKNGCSFAQLGMDLNTKLNDPTLRSKVIVIAEGCVAHWGRSFRELIPSLREGYHVGIESNDIIYAGYSATFMNRNQISAGDELTIVNQKMEGYMQFAYKINSMISQQQMLAWARLVSDVSGIAPTKNMFRTHVKEEDHYQYVCELNENINLQLPLANYCFGKTMSNYILNDVPLARKFSEQALPLMSAVIGLNEWALLIVFRTLTLLSAKLKGFHLSSEEKKYIKSNLKLIQKWGVSSPANYLASYSLAMAEQYHSTGKMDEAENMYFAAIKSAKQFDMRYMTGLAYERLSEFHEVQKNNEKANNFMKMALTEYHNWGAGAKVKELLSRYSYLQNPEQTATKDQTSLMSNSLDLQTILAAATTLSGEIQQDKLLEKMMLILIKNAGAQNAYILEPKDNTFVTIATSRLKNNNVCETSQVPLNQMTGISKKIVQQAFKNKKPVIVDNIQSELSYDHEIQQENITAKSVLCMSIFHQGSVTALIYLDNELSSNVFTEQRLDLLQMLSGQISISLENAQLVSNLEQRVKERTQIIEEQKLEIEKSKEQSETLLRNILPEEIAEELKINGSCKPRRYENVTIMFTDFEKFTLMSEKLTPEEIVDSIDHQYKAFDRIIEKHGVEKIKTIGDAYMCVCGLPNPTDEHADKAIAAAAEILTFVKEYTEDRKANNLPYCNIRIGLHTGPVVAGVVGHNKFAFDIWGDSVNTASRMQSSGEAGRINISNTTYSLIKDQYTCEHRGRIAVKNKGEIEMYFVNDRINK